MSIGVHRERHAQRLARNQRSHHRRGAAQLLLWRYKRRARPCRLRAHIDEVGTRFIVNHARLESPPVEEATEEVVEYAEPEG